MSSNAENVVEGVQTMKNYLERIFSNDSLSYAYLLEIQIFVQSCVGNVECKLIEKIYQLIENFFRKEAITILRRCEALVNTSKKDFLAEYIRSWNQYKHCFHRVNFVSMAVNTNFVNVERKIHKEKVTHSVSDLGRAAFREEVFQPLHDIIAETSMQLIQEDRDGKEIRVDLINQVVKHFNQMGILDTETMPPWRIRSTVATNYKDSFENLFLVKTSEFYTSDSFLFRQSHTILEYALRVERILREEKDRVQRYNLETITKENVIVVCQEVLVEKYLDSFISEFVDELRRVKLDKEKLQLLHQLINSNGDKAGNLITTRLIAQQEVNGGDGTAEMLAKFSHFLLEISSSIDKDKLEKALDDVANIMDSVASKDAFVRFYAELYARRIVSKTSYSHEVEFYMITKLKNVVDLDVWKLERMYKDVCKADELFMPFRNSNGSNFAFDFDVTIMTSYTWPYQKLSTCTLPMALEEATSRYSQYYENLHQNQLLSWNTRLSYGEITSPCFGNYTFIVSADQITVLLLFNEAEEFTLDQIYAATNIEMDYLKQIVVNFHRAKLLVCSDTVEGLAGGSVIRVVDNYENENSIVNLIIPPIIVSESDVKTARWSITADRLSKVQAAIVRIMKRYRKLKHEELMEKTIQQVSAFWQPTNDDIQNGIDSMIDKYYIERDGDENNTYRYVP